MPAPATAPSLADAISPSRLLSSREAAQFLGISMRSLHRLKQDGHLRYVPVGGAIRYRPSTLAAWAESQERTA